MTEAKIIPLRQKLLGPSGEVLTGAAEVNEQADKVAAMESLRDHLDTLRAAALAEGREEDAAALDAGSYAITALIHLNAKAEAQ